MMSPSITISYDLHPPPNTSASNNLASTKSHEIAVKNTTADGQKGYYESLSGSIGEAKMILGEELTAWRDAVGNGEQSKESKKDAKGDEDEDEDGDVEE